MIYVPDTNALSLYLRGSNKNLVERMGAEFAHLRLSVLVVAEREFGFVHGFGGTAYRQRFNELLTLIPVVPLVREDAAHYARIRSHLEKRQQGIGPIDTLIAAQALRLGATVITHNVREFRSVPGLKVEDWQAA
ncbi:MAG: twitching motility protein PilT [Verrucomicrobia bacterium RIFCSPLOWO2_12_FULL_64_8]|nr:MAG: twitching motility protein PilT [Verrucomicrobia bacterium RIFCSPLOWO2_12_FULL_64_8]